MLTLTDLRCEDLVDPLGIDVGAPRLSWRLAAAEGSARGRRQTAYRIMAATSAGALRDGEPDLWDSQVVDSDSTRSIEYGGRPLSSCQGVWWTVRAWDEGGVASDWSAPARWTMGLLEPGDWRARWVGRDEPIRPDRLPARMLRREFDLPAGVSRATVHVSGLGFCDLAINGEPVGDHRFDPALSNYDRRVFYVTHEVAHHLRTGPNAIGIMLGNGRFFAPRSVPAGQPRPRGPNPEDWFEPYAAVDFGFPKLLFQLEIDTVDGRRLTVVSDERWRITADGPIRANNEYDGEEYDARRELKGWMSAGFDDSGWLPAALVDPPKGRLQAQMVEPVRVLEELTPISVEPRGEATWRVDLGRAIYGVARIVVRGRSGTRLAIRGAYGLWPDGRLRVEDNRTGLVTDVYILRGGEPESWEPRFRGQGMRYVEIDADASVELINVTGILLGTDCRQVGEFSCSDPLLQRIWENVRWGHRNYKRSVPLEPDRDERQGWLGDPAKDSESDGYTFDVAAFYRKWLDDILLEQRPDGEIPEVAPAYWEAYHGDLVWPSVVTILPEWLYDFYADRRAVERAYPSIVRWLEFVERSARADGTYDRCQYGDWCDASTIGHTTERPTGATPRPLIATAYHANNLRIAARFAEVLGDPSSATAYAGRARDVRDAFNRAFFDAGRATYGSGSQTSYVLPLAFGLVPVDAEARVVQNLVDEITIRCGGHLSGGLIGMQWLMQTLSRIGRPDVAHLIASQRTRPSWGYMVERGATTIWERWDSDTQGPGMNSEALLILAGNLGAWFYQTLAGIELDPSVPGWRRAFLRPRPVGDLAAARASIDTVGGRFESSWSRSDGTFDWRVTVPPNATATAWVPTSDPEGVTESLRPLREADGIRVLYGSENDVVLELVSGSYRFRADDVSPLR